MNTCPAKCCYYSQPFVPLLSPWMANMENNCLLLELTFQVESPPPQPEDGYMFIDSVGVHLSSIPSIASELV